MCKIAVVYRAPGMKAGDLGQIEAIKIAGPSHVSGYDRSMTLNANETDAFTWTAAHEFGHVIGLKDRADHSGASSVARLARWRARRSVG
jgi:predicted Zn-dependent protease